MDAILRNALLYGALSAFVAMVGGCLSLVRPMGAIWLGRLQVFAVGGVFAILAIELLPDLLIAHHSEAMLSFFAGLALTIAMKLLAGKGRRGRANQPPPLRIATIEALVHSLIAGTLIGSGFVAGLREGLLLTSALTVAMLAIGLVSISRLPKDRRLPSRGIFLLLGLAGSTLFGTVCGATFFWGRAKVDLDLFYAFGMAVILLWAFEVLIEMRDDDSPIHALFFFFIGTMLFMSLAGLLGHEHSDRPGIKQPLTYYPKALPFRSNQWDPDIHIHAPPGTKRNWPSPSG